MRVIVSCSFPGSRVDQGRFWKQCVGSPQIRFASRGTAGTCWRDRCVLVFESGCVVLLNFRVERVRVESVAIGQRWPPLPTARLPRACV